MQLYMLDANYQTLTEAEAAELVPVVPLSDKILAGGAVLRGRLSGKISKAEGPAIARFAVLISARNWAASYVYVVDDMVTNDLWKQYRCTVAGTSDSSGGPTGTAGSITDGGVTWEYVREGPMVLDARDVAFIEAEVVDAPWLLEFEIDMRPARNTGTVFHQWHAAAVSYGQLLSPILPAGVLLPVEGPYPVLLEISDPNVLHVLFSPELDTGSITCMTYVLEAL